MGDYKASLPDYFSGELITMLILGFFDVVLSSILSSPDLCYELYLVSFNFYSLAFVMTDNTS